MHDLMLSYRIDFGGDHIEEFVREVRHPNLSLEVRANPHRAVFAGIEWLMPTVVVFAIAKSYFDGFLKEAGKDHYNALKKGLDALWSAYLAPNRSLDITVIGTRGKVDPEHSFSRILAIYAQAAPGTALKFLFKEPCSQQEYRDQIDAILTALHEYHTGAPESVLRKAIGEPSSHGMTILIRYDAPTRRLEVFDPLLGKLFPPESYSGSKP